MNTRSIISTSVVASALVGGSAFADVFTGSGGAITNNNATGNTFTINVSDSLIMSGVSVTLTNFRHNTVGDLQASLTHVPSGLSVSLFDRIGKTKATSGSGDSSDFLGDYTFADGGGNIWSEAATRNGSGDLLSGTYYATGSGVGFAAATGPDAVSMDATFNGVDAQGDWQLTIRDRSGGDASNSDWTWSLSVATVPAPGALALLGLAGLTGLRRRSR